VIVEDGRDVGRLYEDRHSKPELRWFWSITVYVNPKLGIITSGRAPTIEEAKAQFLASWQKCRSDGTFATISAKSGPWQPTRPPRPRGRGTRHSRNGIYGTSCRDAQPIRA
jgi:hypothetical protein